MDKRELIEQIKQQATVVAEVLRGYVTSHHCPCHWPQFEYWAGKPQGPGWQDGIQNDLVKAAVELQCFEKTPVTVPGYDVIHYLDCLICGTRWKHSSEEWRMLAYRERLVRRDGLSPEAEGYSGLIGANIFATAGQEPSEIRRSLTLDQWIEFMGGTQKEEMPVGSEATTAGPTPPSLIQRIVNALTGRT